MAYTVAIGSGSMADQQPTPQKIWLSLGCSTIATRKPDLKWIESWCEDGSPSRAQLQSLAHSHKIAGIIVPVLAGGVCFFNSATPPFTGCGAEGQQERTISSLIRWAKQQDIPIYLEFDLLDCGQLAEGTKSCIFSQHPDWEELPRSDGHVPATESRFVSPFNGDVRDALTRLVSEATRTFPDATGLCFDLHLSRREILGYSLGARAEAVNELSVDPLQLSLDGRADPVLDQMGQRWLQWRQEKMESFLKELITASKAVNPSARFMVNGDAGYYEYEQLNSARSAQNWAAWSKDAGVTAVVEGRWFENYHDTTSLTKVASSNGYKSLSYVPMLMGSGLGTGCDYASEWLRYTCEARLDSSAAALLVNGEDDMRRAVEFASRDYVDRDPPPFLINQIAPPVSLPDMNGRIWSLSDFAGKKPISIYFAPVIKDRQPTNAYNGDQKIIISPTPIRERGDPGAIVLLDSKHVLHGRFPLNAVIRIDRSGFTRSIAVAFPSRIPTDGDDSSYSIRIGSKAPDFLVADMNGVQTSPRSPRHEITLLTFFPRSFTTGCTSQLASLNAAQQELASLHVRTLAVSVDTFDLQREFAKHLGLSFDLIPDVGRNVCLLYGAVKDVSGLSTRMSVLIDEKGVVRWVDRNINVKTHGEDVVNAVRRMSQNPAS